jgi:hypothetical protein
MKESLPIYIQDHLAGAVFGVELVEALEHDHAGSELGRLAATWKIEIKADQATVQQIVERAGAAPNVVKEVISWLSHRAARLKLRRQCHGDLGTFESLETLALGIAGKEKLWIALGIAAVNDSRISGIDFARLQQRAREQHDAVETYRRTWAAALFAHRDDA